ncbi:MAG: hypothetical protein SYC29_16695 [Planctomycetota bacterium]|nr:hypothetical protein [Planctomycetota bacterium]
MPLINDRDLLLLEPDLFSDAMALATLLIDVADGSVDGTSLTSTDADFEAMDIDAGHAVLIDQVPAEIIERISATEVTVSLPRVAGDDPLIAPAPGSDLSVRVPTFGRQISLCQGWVLGTLGIEVDEDGGPLDASILLNAPEIGRLIALETTARLLRLAAAHDPVNESMAELAAGYSAEVTAARQRTRAVLDLDGDGVADATRRVSLVTLTRT